MKKTNSNLPFEIRKKGTSNEELATQLAEIMSQSGISAVDVTKPPNGLTKAKGDGVTDDTATIQAILDYVGQNGGGTVFFPKGTYMINAISTSTVTGGLKVNYDNMELILSPNATIKVIPNGSDKYDTVTFYNMKNGRISGGKLEGDRLTHNYSSGGTHELGFGVKTDRAENIIIENMLITNFTGDCIITYGANNGVTGYIPSKNIKILNNTLDMSRRNNISVVLGQDILIHGNVITNAGQSDGVNAGCAPMAGIDVEGGSNPWRVKISNNIFKKNLGGSIILFNGNEIIVDGNISDNFIDFQLSSNVLISNNELRNLGDTTHTAIEQTVSGAQSPQGSGVMLAIGAKYIINSRVTLDFTTIGAPDNNAGTVFVATGAGPLGTGDSVTRQLENISITNNQIVGFAGGISVSDTTKNSVIANNVLKAQTTTGIYAKGNVDVIGNSLNEQSIAIRCDGVDLNIKDNVIDNVTNRAIYCIGSASTGEIQNNLITNFKHTINGAIDISAGTWAVIGNVLDCGIVGPPNYAISNSSAGTKISGNTVIGGTFGLAVIRLIQKASVIGNRILGSNAPYGIYSTTTNASNSIVSRNYVEMTSTTGSRYGIFFSGGGTGVKVVNNEVHNASSVLTNSINTDANTTSLIARNLTTSGTILADATDTVTENLSY